MSSAFYGDWNFVWKKEKQKKMLPRLPINQRAEIRSQAIASHIKKTLFAEAYVLRLFVLFILNPNLITHLRQQSVGY